MVKPKIEYDLKEASWKFAFLKFMEISLFLIFIFGFYFVGLYANNLPQNSCNFKMGLQIPCPHTDNPTGFNLWVIGLTFCMLVFLSSSVILLTLIVWGILILIIAFILYWYVMWNWGIAKRWAETPVSKKLREIAREKEKRERWTILEDDVVTIRDHLIAGYRYDDIKFLKRMEKYKGKTAKVIELDVDDQTYRLSIDRGNNWWTVPMLKLKEKRKIE